MKKYQIIFTLTVWMILLLSFYLETVSSQKNRKIYLKDLNKSVTNFNEELKIPIDKIYLNDFKLWDMKISKLLENRVKKLLLENENELKDMGLNNKIKKQNFNIKYRTICIETQCWQLMGIMSINGIKKLTLLNKKPSSKLQVLNIGDELLPGIIIKNIKGESMILLNKEKNKEFILKLFDIDMSQYLPRVLKEKDD